MKDLTVIDKLQKWFNDNGYGIKIHNKQLYLRALTHNSYMNEHNLDYNYQTMEFLGDSILSAQISLYLFHNHPDYSEGEFTKWRSIYVAKGALALCSKEIGLNNFILLGVGETKNHGQDRDKMASDIYESILAAIYLDAQIDPVSVVNNFITKTLVKVLKETNFTEKFRDYKSELQEFLQSGDKRALEYQVVSTTRNKIKTEYRIRVKVGDLLYGEGVGPTKKAAEKDAAKICLNKLIKN